MSVANKCGFCFKELLTHAAFRRRCSKEGILLLGDKMAGGHADREKVPLFKQLLNDRGWVCQTCGALYCEDCLFERAPDHPGGGKACALCGGRFGELNDSGERAATKSRPPIVSSDQVPAAARIPAPDSTRPWPRTPVLLAVIALCTLVAGIWIGMRLARPNTPAPQPFRGWITRHGMPLESATVHLAEVPRAARSPAVNNAVYSGQTTHSGEVIVIAPPGRYSLYFKQETIDRAGAGLVNRFPEAYVQPDTTPLEILLDPQNGRNGFRIDLSK